MALANIVNQAISSTGTGAITLGSALPGFVACSNVFSNGDKVFYSLVDGDDREIGIGTYVSGSNSITRTKIFENLISGVHTINPVSALSTTTATLFSSSPSIQALTEHLPSWKRIFSNPVQAQGAYTPPAQAVVIGGIEMTQFPDAATTEIMVTFPINHDMAASEDMYLGIHWTPTTATAGVVRFGFEYSIAGIGQDYTSTATVYVEPSASGVDKRHQYSEFASPITIPEPGTIIMGRLFRDGAHANDTYAGAINILQMCGLYQARYHGTPAKTSDFFTW